ncbi:type I methionyl aminopeptidase [Algihabitans albus]|uniref:type I methionyl aminopeptidase n=1 Tax=Algihabitans albus TaxID=2164067 RepID=UPI000E5C868D|nr:type I methionyl aminopeptidase [Algihabitans albus]
MTVGSQEDLEQLKAVGQIVAQVLRDMGAALEPGMTTGELDGLGRQGLEARGARSAPETTYGFPGATCISVNNEIAHGIPGERRIAAGDLVNIDVSAERNGFFADTGASFAVPPTTAAQRRLCQTTRKALERAVGVVRAGTPMNRIGKAVEKMARQQGYTIIRNLQSHGVGGALHEEPGYIPSYYDPADRRVLHDGMVITIEPFLSTGAEWAEETGDGWTLATPAHYMTAQYEHSLVVTRGGAIVLTVP